MAASDPLDRAIDEALAQMVGGEPHGAFRAHVMARIAVAPRRTSALGWRPAIAVAAVALVAVIVWAPWRTQPPTSRSTETAAVGRVADPVRGQPHSSATPNTLVTEAEPAGVRGARSAGTRRASASPALARLPFEMDLVTVEPLHDLREAPAVALVSVALAPLGEIAPIEIPSIAIDEDERRDR